MEERAEWERSSTDSVPWLERRRLGRLRAWLRTIGMALGAPRRLMRGLEREGGIGPAFWFALITTAVVCAATFLPLPLIFLPALWVSAGRGGVEFFKPVAGILAAGALISFVGLIVFTCLWGPFAHGVLRLTGRTDAGVRRTCQAALYSSGANVPSAVPFVGMYLGWIWWFVSAILMVKEAQKVHPLRATVALLLLPMLLIAALIWYGPALVGFAPALLSAGSHSGAALQEATSIEDSAERLAALEQYVLDYPETSRRAIAYLEIGKIHEDSGRDEEALEAYLTAATIGTSREIKERLEAAYTEKHGSLDGLHEEIDAVLLARPRPFDPGEYVPDESGSGKVVLAELFTGAQCGPCVAADFAFDGLIERYDRDTLAVLEYHLHIPGPDPMTNPDAGERARYYGTRATPTALVDGAETGMGGGPESLAGRIFDEYTSAIEPRLNAAPEVEIASFQMTREGDRLDVSGDVGVPAGSGTSAGQARLRLVLAEETVHYTGSNGVHFHRFVVRKILGSPEGLALPNAPGTVPFFESVSLAELSAGLEAYLDEYEAEIRQDRPDFEWVEKLHVVDPEQLVAVAFVQDDETLEILQAAFAR